jgi:hypothetical protein
MMVHLPQSAFRVFAIRRHDADIVDALAAARANVEAETRHRSSLQIARIAFFRALSAAPRCPGVRGCHHTLDSFDANIVPRTAVCDTSTHFSGSGFGNSCLQMATISFV